MRYRGVCGIGAVVLAGVAALAAEPLAHARRIEQAFQAAIERAEPAVACLLVYRRPPERNTDPSKQTIALEIRDTVPDYYGSGVVLKSQGLILTNYHVVRDATGVYVRLPTRNDDGTNGPPREGYAKLFAADNRSDLAVLELPPSTRPYTTLEPGEGEKLRKGSLVLAVGHPYAAGFRDGSPSASWGIVSNLRRRLPGSPVESERNELLHNLGTLIQTDARLQLGSSGGALLDLDGKLVGLTTAQAALTGIDMPGGFAVPLDANLRRIVEVLLRGEEVDYGFLGVQAVPSAQRIRPRDEGGVELDYVIPGSPAARAGLQKGDVITRVNGQPVRDQDDLFLNLGASLAGRRAELQVVMLSRGDREPRTLDVVLAKARPPKAGFGKATNRPKDVYGLRVDYISILAQSGEPIPNGVVVREVQPGSPAKERGLAEYVDIITAVNGSLVNTPKDFYREAEKAKASGQVTLTLRHPPRTIRLP
jgi:S1-C subfamily serine protease